jgi:hypothetical protein
MPKVSRRAKCTVNKTNGANVGFEEKMQWLTGELKEQSLKSSQLEEAIHDNIRRLGYDV